MLFVTTFACRGSRPPPHPPSILNFSSTLGNFYPGERTPAKLTVSSIESFQAHNLAILSDISSRSVSVHIRLNDLSSRFNALAGKEYPQHHLTLFSPRPHPPATVFSPVYFIFRTTQTLHVKQQATRWIQREDALVTALRNADAVCQDQSEEMARLSSHQELQTNQLQILMEAQREELTKHISTTHQSQQTISPLQPTPLTINSSTQTSDSYLLDHELYEARYDALLNELMLLKLTNTKSPGAPPPRPATSITNRSAVSEMLEEMQRTAQSLLVHR